MQNQNIDPRKMALINEFEKMASGKKANEMLPLVLAISKKAKSLGIQFTKDEMNIIINNMKAGMSDEEKSRVDMMINMMSMH